MRNRVQRDFGSGSGQNNSYKRTPDCVLAEKPHSYRVLSETRGEQQLTTPPARGAPSCRRFVDYFSTIPCGISGLFPGLKGNDYSISNSATTSPSWRELLVANTLAQSEIKSFPRKLPTHRKRQSCRASGADELRAGVGDKLETRRAGFLIANVERSTLGPVVPPTVCLFRA